MDIRTHLRLFLILPSLLFLLCGCSDKQPEKSFIEPEIKVTFFDVGKGDAILIETAGHNLLIDSGYDKTAGIILNYFRKQDIDQLDYLILTHFDKDHVGGADRILDNTKVLHILQPDYESDGGQYLEYLESLGKKNLAPEIVIDTMSFSLDGTDFLIYPPQQSSYKEEDNDFSLVISMTCKNRNFLFAGDSEKERLNELMDQTEFDLSHDVLKVPHHGKKEKNSEEFLQSVMPKAAVITCAKDTPVNDEIYNILNELDCQIYLTSDGTVTCLCDGDTIQIIQ